MTTDEYWFWLCNIEDIWQIDIKRMLEVFGEPSAIYSATEEQLERSNTIQPGQIKILLESRNERSIAKKIENIRKNNIRFVHYEDADFPDRLREIPDHPYALFVRGRLPDPAKYSVGMVGARTCSEYGAEMAERFAMTLAAADIQVVSGLAIGIDSISARAAIKAGGTTFAVLGSGLDEIYPADNTDLYYEIIMRGGGIISEYAPGTKAIGWHFPHRNRIISGLSDKLLIFEARRSSGTLSTASHALNQGVDIYALPGRVGDPLSEGCNNLIADGAGILLSPKYLMEEIYGSLPGCRAGIEKTETATRRRKIITANKSTAKARRGKISNEYALILSALEDDTLSAEMIGEKTGITEPELSMLLCEMELEGVIAQHGKDCYSL